MGIASIADQIFAIFVKSCKPLIIHPVLVYICGFIKNGFPKRVAICLVPISSSFYIPFSQKYLKILWKNKNNKSCVIFYFLFEPFLVCLPCVLIGSECLNTIRLLNYYG